MSLSARADRELELRYDARVAEAMNRVLEAERSAQSAIADCERQSQESLERARAQRRAILERARERILALHARAAHATEQRTAQIRERGARAPDSSDAPGAGDARLRAAIGSLAERLTRAGEDES